VTVLNDKKPLSVSRRAEFVGTAAAAAANFRRRRPDRQGLLDWVRADERLVQHCASAVDSLEVAARLETFGLSARVVNSRFGYPNVFAAAEVICEAIPFSETEVSEKSMPPMGRPLDLLRGAIYAIPAVFFSVVVLNIGLGSRWWLLPVGLTVSWGTTQAFTVLNWSLRARKDQRSDSLLAAASMSVTALMTLLVALVVSFVLGGTATCVAVTVSLGVYVAASSVLVFHSRERLLLFCLTPALVGSALSLGVISYRAATWCIAVSAGLVVIGALGPLASDRWRVPAISSVTWRLAGKFSVYGVGCGLLTSTVVGFTTHADKSTAGVALAAGPLLVTLGMMEWQLRSLRSRMVTALTESTDLAQFGGRARTALARSLTSYFGSLLGVSLIALVIALIRNLTATPLLLLTVDAIGGAFFLALIFVSIGMIDRVLFAWLVTFAVMVATLLISWATTAHVAPDVGLLSVLFGASSGIVTLALLSRRVICSPLNYEIPTSKKATQ